MHHATDNLLAKKSVLRKKKKFKTKMLSMIKGKCGLISLISYTDHILLVYSKIRYLRKSPLKGGMCRAYFSFIGGLKAWTERFWGPTDLKGTVSRIT